MSVFEPFKSATDLCDIVSVIFTCPSDSTILVTLEGITSEYFIPSVKIPQGGEPWHARLEKEIVQEIFGCGIEINRCVAFRKFWAPHYKCHYLIHSIFEILVSSEIKKKSRNPFGRFRGKIAWVSESELKKPGAILKSPEMRVLFYKKSSTFNMNEFKIYDNFVEVTDRIIMTEKITPYDHLIALAGMNRLTQEVLYREFLWISFPCLYMGFQDFTRFLKISDWSVDDASCLFRAADLNQRNGISFREFLYFLAVTDPSINHMGIAAEIRCKYVFRYLDKSRENYLKRDDFKRFIVLLRRTRKQSIADNKIEVDLANIYSANGWQQDHKVTLPEFIKGVSELKIRGTSQILKSPNSVQKLVKDCLENDIKLKENLPSRSSSRSITPTPSTTTLKHYTKKSEFTIANHVIEVLKNSTEQTHKELNLYEMSISSSSQTSPISNEVAKRHSKTQFNINSSINELLRMVKYLGEINKKTGTYMELNRLSFTWGNIDMAQFSKHLHNVCGKAKELFNKEARMLDLSGPAYILGDLHGNFSDLMRFERILWQTGIEFSPCNLLFLGDYIDRGLYSLEIISYLLAYKAKVPKKIYLLRGNHEIRRIQANSTFEREVLMKFGSKLGPSVYKTINDALDYMPLAALIDGRIFCCHGGIPASWLCPLATTINEIPHYLSDPQEQSALAWELICNDPIGTHGMTDKAVLELQATDGFVSNARRGGSAHFFSAEALEKFLKTNGFTYIVRAHQPCLEGFNVQLKGKLVSVFSSSNYRGARNAAGCILADQLKLRVLKFE